MLNNPIQAPIIKSGRLNHLLDSVFTDAIKIAENEEEYEVCADLNNYIKNLK